jgi:acetoin utilization protein AcuB
MFRKEKIRRAPVMENGRLVGIVSERDLLNATPSSVTTLSIWEMHYLISKVTVKDVMAKNVVTVDQDTPIEEAARIMADKKIGGVPVMSGENVVGIITETDLFKIFLEMFGARDPGVRLSVEVPRSPGQIAKLTQIVLEMGGDILSLGTFIGENTQVGQITLKVSGIDKEKLVNAITPHVLRIMDVRVTGG